MLHWQWQIKILNYKGRFKLIWGEIECSSKRDHILLLVKSKTSQESVFKAKKWTLSKFKGTLLKLVHVESCVTYIWTELWEKSPVLLLLIILHFSQYWEMSCSDPQFQHCGWIAE